MCTRLQFKLEVTDMFVVNKLRLGTKTVVGLPDSEGLPYSDDDDGMGGGRTDSVIVVM